MKNKRRKFLGQLSMVSAGLPFLSETLYGSPLKLSAKSYSRILGSNQRIGLAFQGLGRRFPGLLRSALKLKNVDLLYFCDVMQKQMDNANLLSSRLSPTKVKNIVDVHKIFDDSDVDVIIMATPDHWHAYGACKAMESGKHVYLEKPCSHNMFESEMLVTYQKYYDKIVQMGNQQRSSNHTKQIIESIHDGIIGVAYNAVCFYNNNRGEVPNQVLTNPPAGLNWELFQGPAPRRPYTYDTWDYNWRWYDWDYGTGEAGNNATHELDIARWALDVHYPNHTNVYAKKNHFLDDGWTMYDNMEAKFEFPNSKSINWNGRSRNAFGRKRDGGRGTIVYGTKGSVLINRQEYKLYDIQGILINHVKSNDNESSNSLGGGGNMTTRHLRNFINAIRENEKLNSPIDDAVISQSLVHYANVAYRSDQSFMIDQNSGKIKNRKAKKYWSRDYEPSWEIKKI